MQISKCADEAPQGAKTPRTVQRSPARGNELDATGAISMSGPTPAGCASHHPDKGWPRWAWMPVLMLGSVAYLAVWLAFRMTGNVNYVPTVLILGGLVAPATVLTFALGRIRVAPSIPTLIALVAGGIVSTLLAGIVEFELARHSADNSLNVAGVEELAKLAVPFGLFMALHRRATVGPMTGVVIGIAAGMGFGVLETMGYGLQAYLHSGTAAALNHTLLDRALLSPTRHVAWTAVLTFAMWQAPTLWSRLSRTGRGTAVRIAGVGAPMVAVFAAVVMLHALWDGQPNPVVHALIAVTSVITLIWLIAALDETAPANGPVVHRAPGRA